MVPLNECSTPTFTVSAALAGNATRHANSAVIINFRVVFIRNLTECGLGLLVRGESEQVTHAGAHDPAMGSAVEASSVTGVVVANLRLNAQARHRLVIQR